MANAFSKSETVMFDDVVAGFEDMLVVGKEASIFNMGSAQFQERNNDIVWRPMPYIAVTEDGFDQSSNFGDMTGLSVPATIGYHKVVPKKLTAKNLRDESQLERFGQAAKVALASAINLSLLEKAALQGANFVARTGDPSGYDDLAEADAMMTEIGIPVGTRSMILDPRSYNQMASDLAGRQTLSGKTLNAYERAQLGLLAGFNTLKNDQSYRLTAAAGGATTVNGANQYYTPAATSTAGTGESSNVDNRYSNLTITAADYASIKAGDRFTIEGVNAVHMISKADTGRLQTFTVISKPSANVIKVAPAIISGQGATDAEREYQNVSDTPANGATITWLNTIDGAVSVFFVPDTLELLPGTFTVDPEDGWAVMRATTPELGIAITYTRQAEINDLSVKVRWEVDYGANMLNPLLAGAMMFNQA